MFLIIFYVVWFGFLIAFLIRNEMVYRYKQKMLRKVSAAAHRDIWAGKTDWMWRYNTLSSVEYGEMVYKFWRSFDSFYPDRSFIE